MKVFVLTTYSDYDGEGVTTDVIAVYADKEMAINAMREEISLAKEDWLKYNDIAEDDISIDDYGMEMYVRDINNCDQYGVYIHEMEVK